MSFGVERTINSPLYPLFTVPAVFCVLVTFLTVIFSPTTISCGISATRVTVDAVVEQVLMNLGFLSKSTSLDVILVAVKSELDLAEVELDS